MLNVFQNRNSTPLHDINNQNNAPPSERNSLWNSPNKKSQQNLKYNVGMIFKQDNKLKSQINNLFDICLHRSYVIRRLCTNGIPATIEMGVQCEWVVGKTCVIQKTVRQQIDHFFIYSKIFSHRSVTGLGAIFFDLVFYLLNQKLRFLLKHYAAELPNFLTITKVHRAKPFVK